MIIVCVCKQFEFWSENTATKLFNFIGNAPRLKYPSCHNFQWESRPKYSGFEISIEFAIPKTEKGVLLSMNVPQILQISHIYRNETCPKLLCSSTGT